MNDACKILTFVAQEVDAGRRAALCVIVSAQGSTPQTPGAMLAVTENESAVGTVGGGFAEADIKQHALTLINKNKSEIRTVNLDNDAAAAEGMICGGRLTVATQIFSTPSDVLPLKSTAELLQAGRSATLSIKALNADVHTVYKIFLEAPPKLFIAGAGHLGLALASVASPLGFHIKVLDDRPEYAHASRFPPPIRCITGDIPSNLRLETLGPDSYVVIVTRGHKCDEAALEAVIRTPARYLGMVGSKRKIQTIFNNLRARDIADDLLARVYAPIGLAINAVTPEEIAVSIAAELISVRRENRRNIVEGPISTP